MLSAMNHKERLHNRGLPVRAVASQASGVDHVILRGRGGPTLLAASLWRASPCKDTLVFVSS